MQSLTGKRAHGSAFAADVHLHRSAGPTLIDALTKLPVTQSRSARNEKVENAQAILTICSTHQCDAQTLAQACVAEQLLHILCSKMMENAGADVVADIHKIIGVPTARSTATVHRWMCEALRSIACTSSSHYDFFSPLMPGLIAHAMSVCTAFLHPRHISEFAHSICSADARRHFVQSIAHAAPRAYSNECSMFKSEAWSDLTVHLAASASQCSSRLTASDIVHYFDGKSDAVDKFVQECHSFECERGVSVLELCYAFDKASVFEAVDFTQVFLSAACTQSKRLQLRTFEEDALPMSIAELTNLVNRYQSLGMHRAGVLSRGMKCMSPVLRQFSVYIAETHANMLNGPHSCAKGKLLRKEFNALTSPGYDATFDSFMCDDMFHCSVSTPMRGKLPSPERVKKTIAHLHSVNNLRKQLDDKTFKYFLPHGVQQSCCHLNTLTSRLVCLGIVEETDSLFVQQYACFATVEFARHITDKGRHPGHGLVGLSHSQFHIVQINDRIQDSMLAIQKHIFESNSKLQSAKKLISYMLQHTTLITMAMKPCGLLSMHGGMKNALSKMFNSDAIPQVTCHGLSSIEETMINRDELMRTAFVQFVYQMSEMTTSALHFALKVYMQSFLTLQDGIDLPFSHPAAITPNLRMFDSAMQLYAREKLAHFTAVVPLQLSDVSAHPNPPDSSLGGEDQDLLSDGFFYTGLETPVAVDNSL